MSRRCFLDRFSPGFVHLSSTGLKVVKGQGDGWFCHHWQGMEEEVKVVGDGREVKVVSGEV